MRLTDEQIGAELHALREVPSEQFAAELDAWAAEGFPSIKDLDAPSRPRVGLKALIGRRPLLSAAAGAAVIVAVVGVSVAAYLHENNIQSEPLSASGDDSAGLLSGKVQNSALRGSAPAAAGSGAAPDFAAAPPGSRPRNGRAQIQQLSASLGLATDADEIQGAADGVVDVTNRYDGFVDSSDVHVGGRQSHASFSLRIPAAHMRDALDEISSLGRVTVRDEGSTNVTGAYVDAGKAYRDARAKVDSLLAQLEAASTASEAAAIRQQLVPARQQLVAAREALRSTKQRVTYAPVTVQIRADQGDGSWSIGDAADDAGNVLKAIVGGTLVTLAVLVPLAALLALMWFGAGVFTRRRRETTLDRS